MKRFYSEYFIKNIAVLKHSQKKKKTMDIRLLFVLVVERKKQSWPRLRIF